eukprot:2178580-Prymnesium_polylepis.1
MPISPVVVSSRAPLRCAACAAGMRCSWYVVRCSERTVSAGRRAAVEAREAGGRAVDRGQD